MTTGHGPRLSRERATGSTGERMVATSHPLAVQAAIDILDRGGTAADAAVAAAAVLNVVDPRSTGVGGDAFCMYWPSGDRSPSGLAAAGAAPARMTCEAVRAAGHATMPDAGPWSVTIPGAVAGWDALLSRFGRLGLGDVLAPAIRIAHDGFAVTPMVAEEWKTAAAKLKRYEASAHTYLPSGRAPRAGETFFNPDLAATLDTIAAEGAQALYKGRLAEAIGAAVASTGGPLRADDLAGWSGPEWVAPLEGRYRGVDVYEMPPPGQGIAVLSALGIYDVLQLSDAADKEHGAIEAMKMAFADADAYVADPRVVDVPGGALLSPRYLARRAGEIDLARASIGRAGRPGDTVYVAVVDEQGNACSFIQSLYEGFGSGLTASGTGIVLQNRGSNFVVDPGHPNCVAPGKRPYHTIIPAQLGRAGEFFACLGVVGGFMQPQGQMQIIRRLIDDGASPAEAVGAPRWRYLKDRIVAFEPGYDPDTVSALEHRGHVIQQLGRFRAGGAQLIVKSGDGLTGASDPRKDGTARG